jgi:hypothetical protein
MSVKASNITAYLTGALQMCSGCGQQIDWWKSARCVLEENFMGNLAYSLVGAQTTVFAIVLKPGGRTIYRFSEHGVPSGAKVLYVNYTPNGGSNAIFPLEVHGNSPTNRFRSDEVVLFPMPISNEGNPVETKVSVMVTWVPQADADEGWQSLFDAFEAFVAGKYASMIVPANVAVESSLLHLMTSYVDHFVGKKQTENFLSNAATYSHQLNVLLPMFAQLNGLPRLPTHIVGTLNRLRGIRNNLAHEGVTDAELDKKSASELLCGALFAFHYVRYLAQPRFRQASQDFNALKSN